MSPLHVGVTAINRYRAAFCGVKTVNGRIEVGDVCADWEWMNINNKYGLSCCASGQKFDERFLVSSYFESEL